MSDNHLALDALTAIYNMTDDARAKQIAEYAIRELDALEDRRVPVAVVPDVERQARTFHPRIEQGRSSRPLKSESNDALKEGDHD